MAQRTGRITPEDEEDRIAEQLSQQRARTIVDRDTFDLAFHERFGVENRNQLTQKQQRLQDRTFAAYQQQHPSVSKERLYQQAGGKTPRGLRADRRKNAKIILKRVPEGIRTYKVRGATQ